MIKVFRNEELLATQISSEMRDQLLELDHPVFCLASGSTPAKCYNKFVSQTANLQEIEKLNIVSLDEWVGIPKESEGSCYQMLNQDLFQHLLLKEKQITFFKTVDVNLQEECQRIDKFIKDNPITFSLMGVGMNGHIGLNEPGTSIKDYSSVVPLSDTTKKVGQKYFNQQTKFEQGITLGLQQIINSKRVVVIVTGKHKQKVVKEIIENPNAKLPAQELLGKEHIDFYFDMEAAALLKPEYKEFINE